MKKRKDGLYASQVYLGKEDGKRKYKTVYGATQKEVKVKVAELKLKQGKGIDIAAADDSFGVWADRYVERKKAQNLSASYIIQIENERRHLRALDELPISKVTINNLQVLIDRLTRHHDGRGPLSKRTIIGIIHTANQVFRLAIASRAIEYNPAEYVIVPGGVDPMKREALNDEQQEWVRTVSHRAQRAAMIMMYAGLRRGELLALTWADVNLKEKTITVKKAVAFEKGKPINKDSTKTDAGMRVVSIPDILASHLKAERVADDCIYVVHTNDGRQLSKSGWRRLWESYMAEINLKIGYAQDDRVHSRFHPSKLEMRIDPFTPHQLRHTFCSIMYMAGVDVMTARDQMGHSDIKTTLQIYTHLDKKHKKKSIQKMNGYLCKYDASNGT
ncbi:site-specific integrase [Ruminococcaceae bacterium OttesenSCG-928-I18]|nr:site-specific integrase [Ruminococcaceae bacterium OttesenSCG-928-I18]